MLFSPGSGCDESAMCVEQIKQLLRQNGCAFTINDLERCVIAVRSSCNLNLQFANALAGVYLVAFQPVWMRHDPQ